MLNQGLTLLLEVVGLLAGIYACSGIVEERSQRAPISVALVVSRLDALVEADDTSMTRIPHTVLTTSLGQDEVDDPDLHLLRGSGVSLGYFRREGREHVAVTLPETAGLVACFFEDGTLTKLILDHSEFEGDRVPPEMRAELGTLLKYARLIVRKHG